MINVNPDLGLKVKLTTEKTSANQAPERLSEKKETFANDRQNVSVPRRTIPENIKLGSENALKGAVFGAFAGAFVGLVGYKIPGIGRAAAGNIALATGISSGIAVKLYNEYSFNKSTPEQKRQNVNVQTAGAVSLGTVVGSAAGLLVSRLTKTDPLKTTLLGGAIGGSVGGMINLSKKLPMPGNNDGVSTADGKTRLAPLEKDNGKDFHLFFALNTQVEKLTAVNFHKYTFNDDITRLRKQGYTVIIDNNATRDEFKEVVYNPRTAGFIWSGHGGDGSLFDYKDQEFGFFNLEEKKVSPNLKLAVFEACETGKVEKYWSDSLNKAKVAAWDRTVSGAELYKFNTDSEKEQNSLRNLIKNHLLE